MIGRRGRFAAPFVVVGLIAAGAVMPSAAAAPKLPTITPAKLVAKVLSDRVDTFSGTLKWSADAGLPSISALTEGGGQGLQTSSGFDPTSLLSGTHQFSIWVDGASRQRIEAASDLAETDLVHNGSGLWLWNSSDQHVTRYVPAHSSHSAHVTSATTIAATRTLDPQTAAVDLLRRLDRTGTTTVTVAKTARIAGVAAYQLQLSPAGAAKARSTVSAILIAVDASNGFPLRITVDAVGQSTPALQFGFTKVGFGAPAASIFQEPKGRSTSTQVIGGHTTSPAVHGIAVPPLAGGPPMVKVRKLRAPVRGLFGGSAMKVRKVAAAPPTAAALPSPERSIGTGWATIGVFSLPASSPQVMAELHTVSTAVSGAWGSGRLVSSSLVNALVLPDGQVLAGFVHPAVLEAAAAGH